MEKRALVFGASGQAGYYLCRLLREKGYEVMGTGKGQKSVVDLLMLGVDCRVCLLQNPEAIDSLVKEFSPTEVYNLAAEMFAPASWEDPGSYMCVNAVGTAYILRTLLTYLRSPGVRYFQAGSAGVFAPSMQRKSIGSPLGPRDPYHVSKLAAQELTTAYRESKGLFACTGVFFNMESPRRGKDFFSRYVTREVVRIKEERLGHVIPITALKVGDLSGVRDWGLVEEYMEAAWLMLQAERPKDYVIATGESHTCEEFVREAFRTTNTLCGFAGNTEQPLGFMGREPDMNNPMLANPIAIKKDLGWEAKTKFKGVVHQLCVAAQKELMDGESSPTRQS